MAFASPWSYKRAARLVPLDMALHTLDEPLSELSLTLRTQLLEHFRVCATW